MKIIKQIKARLSGAPFMLDDHWQPWWHEFNREKRLLDGFRVLQFDEPGFVRREPVAVLTGNGFTHFYTVEGWRYAPGDDHIVSSKHFTLQYHHSERMK